MGSDSEFYKRTLERQIQANRKRSSRENKGHAKTGQSSERGRE